MELLGSRACFQESANFFTIQCSSHRRLVIGTDFGVDELPECYLMLITAILAWRLVADTSGLAAGFIDVVVSAQALKGGGKAGSRAMCADESINKSSPNIGFCDFHAAGVVPVLAFDALHHQGMIVRSLADAV
jgi:hypothetical protein